MANTYSFIYCISFIISVLLYYSYIHITSYLCMPTQDHNRTTYLSCIIYDRRLGRKSLFECRVK